jgi:hypothetical protein
VHSDEQAGGGITRQPNKGMKLTKPGQLRSFAAYPQCWADVGYSPGTSVTHLSWDMGDISGHREVPRVLEEHVTHAGAGRLHRPGGAQRADVR